MEPRDYGSLPTATVEEPIASTHARRRRAVALVAAFVAVAAAARSRTRATATALDEMGDVCLAHVAAGDTFLEVSQEPSYDGVVSTSPSHGPECAVSCVDVVF